MSLYQQHIAAALKFLRRNIPIFFIVGCIGGVIPFLALSLTYNIPIPYNSITLLASFCFLTIMLVVIAFFLVAPGYLIKSDSNIHEFIIGDNIDEEVVTKYPFSKNEKIESKTQDLKIPDNVKKVSDESFEDHLKSDVLKKQPISRQSHEKKTSQLAWSYFWKVCFVPVLIPILMLFCLWIQNNCEYSEIYACSGIFLFYVVTLGLRLYGGCKIKGFSSKSHVILLLLLECSIISSFFLACESYLHIIIFLVIICIILFCGFLCVVPSKGDTNKDGVNSIVVLSIGALALFFLTLYGVSNLFKKPENNNFIQNILMYPLEMMQISNYSAKFLVASRQNQVLLGDLLDQSTRTEYGGVYTKPVFVRLNLKETIYVQKIENNIPTGNVIELRNTFLRMERL